MVRTHRLVFLALALSVAALGLTTAAEAAGKKTKSREMYFLSEEKIPPNMNYMSQVFDTSKAITHIRSNIERMLTRRGYRAHNYGMTSNRVKYSKQHPFLHVKTDMEVTKRGRDEFLIKVTTVATLFEYKDGKRIKRVKGKASSKVVERYHSGIADTIEAAFASIEPKFPKYSEY
jgi:hypothetical protein